CCRLPDSVPVAKGDYCIIEYTQGTQDYGRLISFVESAGLFRMTVTGKVLRKVTEEDWKVIQDNCSRKEEAFRIAQEKIKQHGLPMKLLDVEYSFDRCRLTFYYWAEKRIDFRRLVRDLASVFNCRIEMRQIGLRDEARVKGGCGLCGRILCCSLWLREFESITMRMVKNQKLPLDLNKITGPCGRLLCCLSFEDIYYQEKGESK
ncbi:MAG TPA: regulatory iron-sulfur-containing complex subunit RicT, partial [bacterium]|nr:regulatory iron-sulfur-containing complex subunit RicT [bacterium]